MEDENKKLLEDAIKRSLESLDDPKDESYSKQVSDICKLYDLKISEEKIAEDANSKAMQRGADSEKLDYEAALKKEETKQTIFRSIGDIGKTALTLLAYGIWLGQIMTFEQTGTIRSKAFGFIGKPKI